MFAYPMRVLSGPDQSLPDGTDDSAGALAGPCPRREELRNARLRPSCIQNRWGEICTRKEASERSIACRNEELRERVRVAFFDHSSEGALNFGERGCKQRASGVNDQIPPRPQLFPVQAKGRSDSPLDAVTFDGAANCPGNSKTDPGSCWAVTCAALGPLIA